jgi:hypothetical protein
MPNDWAVKVSNAINNLKLKTDRVVEPDQSLALIDDVVAGKFAAAELAVIHGLPQEGVRTTLGRVTRAVGTGGVRSLEAGGCASSSSSTPPPPASDTKTITAPPGATPAHY